MCANVQKSGGVLDILATYYVEGENSCKFGDSMATGISKHLFFQQNLGWPEHLIRIKVIL